VSAVSCPFGYLFLWPVSPEDGMRTLAPRLYHSVSAPAPRCDPQTYRGFPPASWRMSTSTSGELKRMRPEEFLGHDYEVGRTTHDRCCGGRGPSRLLRTNLICLPAGVLGVDYLPDDSRPGPTSWSPVGVWGGRSNRLSAASLTPGSGSTGLNETPATRRLRTTTFDGFPCGV